MRAEGVAFAATTRMASVVPVTEVPFVAVGIGIRLLLFAVFVGIWRNLPPQELAGSGTTISALLTYSALAQVLGPLLNPTTTLTVHVANGTIAVRMLRPAGLVSQFVGEWLGGIAPAIVLGAAAVCLSAVPLHVSLAPAPGAAPSFAVSLVLAVVVGVAVDFWFGLLSVRLGNGTWFVAVIRTASIAILSGALIPLSLMPWHIGAVLGVLPFAAMASGPLVVYTHAGPDAGLLAEQAAWAVALWLLLALWYARSRDKVVGFGG